MTSLHGAVIGPMCVAAANALHHEALACTHDCGGILVSQMSFALPSGNRKVISGIALDPDALKCCSSRSLPGMHKSLSAQAIPRTPRDADDRANRSGCSRRFFPHAGLARKLPAIMTAAMAVQKHPIAAGTPFNSQWPTNGSTGFRYLDPYS